VIHLRDFIKFTVWILWVLFWSTASAENQYLLSQTKDIADIKR